MIYCDAAVNRVDEFGPDDELKLEMVGGGGTDFRPPFAYVEEHDVEPQCLVYLTDMYGAFPEQSPEYPTMWATFTENIEAPFGETVRIDAAAENME